MITPQELREAASLSPMSAAKYNAAAYIIESLQNELKAEKENHRITMDSRNELDKVVENLKENLEGRDRAINNLNWEYSQLKEENARLEEQRGEAAEIAEQHTGE